MAENTTTTVELKQSHITYLEEMANEHNLPDSSKALRCLITYAMEKTEQEATILDEVRCANC